MLIPLQSLLKKYNLKPRGVLHVGASEGQEAEVYRQAGIGKAIFIEAIPAVYRKLYARLLKHPRYAAYNLCITDKDGDVVKFNISNNGGQSSSIYEFGTHTAIHPGIDFIDRAEFPTTRLDTLFATHDLSYDYLEFINFDLQGCELLALKGMGDLIDRVQCAYLEVNKRETYKGCALLPEVTNYMNNNGLYMVEQSAWVGDSWADSFWVRRLSV